MSTDIRRERLHLFAQLFTEHSISAGNCSCFPFSNFLFNHHWLLRLIFARHFLFSFFKYPIKFDTTTTTERKNGIKILGLQFVRTVLERMATAIIKLEQILIDARLCRKSFCALVKVLACDCNGKNVDPTNCFYVDYCMSADELVNIFIRHCIRQLLNMITNGKYGKSNTKILELSNSLFITIETSWQRQGEQGSKPE